MTFDPNDPKWTAYVLDELSPEERRQVEQLLAESPEARQLVEEIRSASEWLGEELQNVPSPALTDEGRSRILQRASRSRWLGWSLPVYLKAAAMIVLVAGASLLYLNTLERPQTITLALKNVDPEPSTQPVSLQETAQQREAQQAANRQPPPSLAIEKAVDKSEVPNISPGAPSDPLAAQQAARKNVPVASAGEERQAPAQPAAVSAPPPEVIAGYLDQAKVGARADDLRDQARMEFVQSQEGKQLPGRGRIEADRKLAFNEAERTFTSSFFKRDASDVVADRARPLTPTERFNTESYDHIQDNPFLRVADNPRSTFSIDVDTASYSNLRRFLNQGQRPPKDAVRIEEMINYFQYDYAPPRGKHPFAVHLEVASAPWNPQHRLLRVGLKGMEVSADERPAANLVFLIDVSGSMRSANKLPLLKQGMKLMVDELADKDRVAIAVYAGAAGLVLPSTPCTDKYRILEALDRLRSGGSTAGAAGIRLAYQTAQQNFIEGGINRVILATDGDFNVGVSSDGELVRIIEEKRQSGVFLSVLGFGTGNYKDSKLEKLADKGNGNYAYVDTLREARKVLVEEMGGTLMTIAKDVKIQVEFNPLKVGAYRLIGYENRLLAAQDFNDDRKDAGEIGAGHTVTALFELIPAGLEGEVPGLDPLKYQAQLRASPDASQGEMATVKLRYKQPDQDTSRLIEIPLRDAGLAWQDASRDFMFASGVAAFGMILRDSPHKGSATLDSAAELAESGMGRDPSGRRAEFLSLVKSSRGLLR